MKNLAIEKSILINASAKEVFEALTNSEKIVQYYPLDEVISNWQVGDEIICKGNNNGVNFTDYGIIDILIPNQKFQYSYWSDNHGTEKTAENYLTITYTLQNSEKGTLVIIEHSNLKSETMYELMINVWDFLLNNLKNFVEKN